MLCAISFGDVASKRRVKFDFRCAGWISEPGLDDAQFSETFNVGIIRAEHLVDHFPVGIRGRGGYPLLFVFLFSVDIHNRVIVGFGPLPAVQIDVAGTGLGRRMPAEFRWFKTTPVASLIRMNAFSWTRAISVAMEIMSDFLLRLRPTMTSKQTPTPKAKLDAHLGKRALC